MSIISLSHVAPFFGYTRVYTLSSSDPLPPSLSDCVQLGLLCGSVGLPSVIPPSRAHQSPWNVSPSLRLTVQSAWCARSKAETTGPFLQNTTITLTHGYEPSLVSLDRLKKNGLQYCPGYVVDSLRG